MHVFVVIAMAVVLSCLWVMIRKSRKMLEDPFAAAVAEPERWPSATLVIPVAGDDPAIPASLESILGQDYPDFEVVFTIQDETDPAAATVARLMEGRERVRRVFAGPSSRCGQKNHNLLAGLAVVGDDREVLAFCDSTHVARADWLRELIRPIALGEAELSGGFHLAVPLQGGFIAWGQTLSALFIYLMKCFPKMDQTWGGATAIRADCFRRLDTARAWAESSFDDACLNVLRREAGLPLAMTPRAVMYTFLRRQNLAGWRHWVLRQWLGLKFYCYWDWLGAGVACCLCALLMVYSAGALIAAAAGWIAPAGAVVAAVYLMALALLALRLRGVHPRPACAPLWVAAFFANVLLSAWVHRETWFTMELPWKDFVYRVAPGGKVLEIRKR